jgi:hypothetical protein
MKNILIALALIAGIGSAQAITLEQKGHTVIVSGDILVGDGYELARFLTPDIKTVELNSTGGNMSAGYGMGNVIRANHLNTLVDVTKGDTCRSACTMAFSGGIERTYHNPKRDPFKGLGYHKAHNVVTGEEFGAGTALFFDAYYEFGTPNACKFVNLAAPNEIFLIGSSTALDEGISTKD